MSLAPHTLTSIPAFSVNPQAPEPAELALQAGIGAMLFEAPDLLDPAAVADKVAGALPPDYDGDLVADLTTAIASFAGGPIAPNAAELLSTATAISSKMLMPNTEPPTEPQALASYLSQLEAYRAEALTSLVASLPATLGALASLAPKAVDVANVVQDYVLVKLNELVTQVNTQLSALQAEYQDALQSLREELE